MVSFGYSWACPSPDSTRAVSKILRNAYIAQSRRVNPG
ncbi:hypothetical protein SS05631_c14620 [Sinorhizobium sp. CCBAU 05631]|nr:hypothetical protein SS05631_c14620 [Sinorhizobium sp. CCBAU 05631]